MVNDLGPGFGEMASLVREVHAVSHGEERPRRDQGSFTGTPDMSHEPRPEERKESGKAC